MIRHAQSVWNADGRAQGWLDPPLSEAGQAEADRVGRRLRRSGPAFALVVSSDLRRSMETADILARELGRADRAVDARLREREMGWWSGLRAHEMEARWPQELAAWRAHQAERPPGGESTASVVRRAEAALRRLGHGPEPVLVVSHGGVIAALEPSHLGPRRGHLNLSGVWLEVGADGIKLAPDRRFEPEEPATAAAVETG